MEKLTDKIAVLPKDGDYFSLEFFPPKTSIVQYQTPNLSSKALRSWFLGLFKSTDAP